MMWFVYACTRESVRGVVSSVGQRPMPTDNRPSVRSPTQPHTTPQTTKVYIPKATSRFFPGKKVAECQQRGMESQFSGRSHFPPFPSASAGSLVGMR